MPYLLGWLLGVPVVVLVILYLIFSTDPSGRRYNTMPFLFSEGFQ